MRNLEVSSDEDIMTGTIYLENIESVIAILSSLRDQKIGLFYHLPRNLQRLQIDLPYFMNMTYLKSLEASAKFNNQP